jgi:hypothetical protein
MTDGKLLTVVPDALQRVLALGFLRACGLLKAEVPLCN